MIWQYLVRPFRQFSNGEKSSTGCVGFLLSTLSKASRCPREWRRESGSASTSSRSRSGRRCPTRRRSWSEVASTPIQRRGWPSTKCSRQSGFRWVDHFYFSSLPNTCDLFQQCNTVPQTPLQTGSILKEQTEEEKEGLSLALREVREGFAAHQNNFILKNPKLDSNSALANRRKSKNSSSEASSLNSSACDVKSIQEN